jgi:hypothetical protein
VAIAACSGPGLGREYEYEEQLYLYPDGSAAVVLNASVPALVALRGLALDPAPRARIDRGEVREMVSEPGLEIARVSRPWRRKGRQFIQIRAEIDDVTKLGATKLFQWSTYALTTTPEGRREYRQLIGAPAVAPPSGAGWDGSEIVAFKLHLPSRVVYHNVKRLEDGETGAPERGNILTWEQRLSDRRANSPIEMEVRMDSASILYRTLWLFASAFAGAVVVLGSLIWITIRRAKRRRRLAA